MATWERRRHHARRSGSSLTLLTATAATALTTSMVNRGWQDPLDLATRLRLVPPRQPVTIPAAMTIPATAMAKSHWRCRACSRSFLLMMLALLLRCLLRQAKLQRIRLTTRQHALRRPCLWRKALAHPAGSMSMQMRVVMIPASVTSWCVRCRGCRRAGGFTHPLCNLGCRHTGGHGCSVAGHDSGQIVQADGRRRGSRWCWRRHCQERHCSESRPEPVCWRRRRRQRGL